MSRGPGPTKIGIVETRQAAAVEVAVGASAYALDAAAALTRRARPVLRPALATLLRPPLVPEALAPARFLGPLRERGAIERARNGRQLSALLDRLVPLLLEEVLRRADLTGLIRDHVDLDAVADLLDVDAVAYRLDVDAVARRLDLDVVAGRLDVDAVARRLDLEAVLDRLDLTQVVLRRVDLDVLVQAVLDRIDLAGLAEEVIEEVDLPEIIRESTGTMASGTVRDARMQGILADQAVSRVRDRLRLRRGPRSSEAVVEAEVAQAVDVPLPAQRPPGG
jgi:hypothetical protein